MTMSLARHARSAAVLCAGAALLGLSACGPAEEPPPASDSTPAESSTQTAQQGEESSSSEETTADESTDGDDGTRTDEEQAATAAPGDRTRIMLVTDLQVDDGHGEGAPLVSADQLASLLAGPFDGAAECSGELELAPDAAAVDCMGPMSVDRTEATQKWVANVVMVPVESGLEDGSQVAVLFSTGTALPEEADDLLEDDVVLTGVGVGSMYGAEPLTAEDVAEGTLATLTSEQAYVPVAGMAEWSEVTCEDGLDFAVFETVDCTATTADGTRWELDVAPGTYADNDQGLLVGIEIPRED